MIDIFLLPSYFSIHTNYVQT